MGSSSGCLLFTKKQNKTNKKRKNPPTHSILPLFLPGSGFVWSGIVLFSVCAVKSFDIHLVPTFGISVGEEELDTNKSQLS